MCQIVAGLMTTGMPSSGVTRLSRTERRSRCAGVAYSQQSRGWHCRESRRPEGRFGPWRKAAGSRPAEPPSNYPTTFAFTQRCVLGSR